MRLGFGPQASEWHLQVADVAFAYATGTRCPQVPQLSALCFTWTCRWCQRLVCDYGPARPHPARGETGHAPACWRHEGDIRTFEMREATSSALGVDLDMVFAPASAQKLIDEPRRPGPRDPRWQRLDGIWCQHASDLLGRLLERAGEARLPEITWAVSPNGFLLGDGTEPGGAPGWLSAWRQALSAWLGRGPDADSQRFLPGGGSRVTCQWVCYEDTHLILAATVSKDAGG